MGRVPRPLPLKASQHVRPFHSNVQLTKWSRGILGATGKVLAEKLLRYFFPSLSKASAKRPELKLPPPPPGLRF